MRVSRDVGTGPEPGGVAGLLETGALKLLRRADEVMMEMALQLQLNSHESKYFCQWPFSDTSANSGTSFSGAQYKIAEYGLASATLDYQYATP